VTAEKVCTICRISKPITEFYKHKNGLYGVIGTCKTCYSLKQREKYKNNNEYREQRKKYAKDYYRQNSEQVKLKVKQWMQDNPEYVKRYVQKWQNENREYYRVYIRDYQRWRRRKL
jgi:hypothetical protein